MAKRKPTKTARRLSNFFYRGSYYAAAQSVLQDSERGYSLEYWRYQRQYYKEAWRRAGWLDFAHTGNHPLRKRSPKRPSWPCGAFCWTYIDADIEARARNA